MEEGGCVHLLFTQHMDIISDKVLLGTRQVDQTLVTDFGTYILRWAIIGLPSNDFITPLVRISLNRIRLFINSKARHHIWGGGLPE